MDHSQTFPALSLCEPASVTAKEGKVTSWGDVVLTPVCLTVCVYPPNACVLVFMCACVCVCIYVCVYMCVCMCLIVCKHMYMYIYVQPYMYIYVYAAN